MEGDLITLQELFVFQQTGLDENRKVKGRFKATGVRPKFAERLAAKGVALRPISLIHKRCTNADRSYRTGNFRHDSGVSAGVCSVAPHADDPAGRIARSSGSQKWSAPEAAAQLEIVRKESLSDIPWLNELLIKMRRFQPLRVLHRQADCRVPLGYLCPGDAALGTGGIDRRMSMLHAFPSCPACAGGLLGALPAGYLYWLKSQRMASLSAVAGSA